MGVKKDSKYEEDVKLTALKNAGYWELDKRSCSLLKEHEKKKELESFMRLHRKQISDILRSW